MALDGVGGHPTDARLDATGVQGVKTLDPAVLRGVGGSITDARVDANGAQGPFDAAALDGVGVPLMHVLTLLVRKGSMEGAEKVGEPSQPGRPGGGHRPSIALLVSMTFVQATNAAVRRSSRPKNASSSRRRRKEHVQKGVVWNEEDQQVVNVTEGLIAMAPIVLSPASVRLSRCRIA